MLAHFMIQYLIKCRNEIIACVRVSENQKYTQNYHWMYSFKIHGRRLRLEFNIWISILTHVSPASALFCTYIFTGIRMCDS